METGAPSEPMDIGEFYKWRTSGETGMSSLAMVKAVTGAYVGRYVTDDYPLDNADMMRCVRLVHAVPRIREHFAKIAALSPEWAKIIANFDVIERLADEEIPDWRTDPSLYGAWTGPLNAFVRLLIDRSV